MADRRRAPVEGYKIGPKERAFMRTFRNVLRSETMLQVIGQEQSQKMKRILDMYQQLRGTKERLLGIPPATVELPGQNFQGESEQEQGQPQQEGSPGQGEEMNMNNWQIQY